MQVRCDAALARRVDANRVRSYTKEAGAEAEATLFRDNLTTHGRTGYSPTTRAWQVQSITKHLAVTQTVRRLDSVTFVVELLLRRLEPQALLPPPATRMTR